MIQLGTLIAVIAYFAGDIWKIARAFVHDHFVLLNRGRVIGDHAKADVTRETLVREMAGGEELDALTHEIEGVIHA